MGSGILTLSGQNTFSSGTNGASPDITINGGTLNAAGVGAIPTGSAVTLANSSGATLQVTSNQTINTLSGGGALGGNVVLNNATLTVGVTPTLGQSMLYTTYAGSISGSGSLAIAGSPYGGGLMLTGMNTYTGATTINEDDLVAGAPNTFSSGSAVVMTNLLGRLYVGTFNQTIGSLAGVGTIALGGATLTIGADNTSTTFTGQIGDVMGTSSTIVKIGNGTLTLELGSDLEDPIQVSAGTLNLEGNIYNQSLNDVTVGSGGAFKGVGTLQNLTNNGVVNPGANGVGTLTAAAYSGAGALNINFNGAPTNLLKVTGNATLTGGTLNLLGSTFTPGSYTVLSAGSITGTFSVVDTPDLEFLKYATLYNSQSVQIEITPGGFVTAAQNSNQQNVAVAFDALQATGNSNFMAVSNALAQVSPSQAAAALSQISGDALASFQSVGLRNVAAFNNQMMLDHGAPDNAAATAGLAMPVQLAYEGDARNLGGMNSGKPQDPNGIWARGIGLFDKTNGDASLGSPGSTSNTGGFEVGYDYTLSDEVLLGVSGGYAKTNLNDDDRSSSGNSIATEGGLCPWPLRAEALGFSTCPWLTPAARTTTGERSAFRE